MAAQRAAILTSQMLGLKPGRQPHIIHVYAEDVALHCMVVKEKQSRNLHFVCIFKLI